MAAKMVTDLVYVRYTADPIVIEECLRLFFPEEDYPGVQCTYEAPEDGNEKWIVCVPKLLTNDQKFEIQRRFREAYFNGQGGN